MSELDPAALANLLTDYCLAVSEGEQILVTTTSLAAPLIVALQRSILERGAWPHFRVSVPMQDTAFFESARDSQLDSVSSVEMDEMRAIDKHLRIAAPATLDSLASIDPDRLGRWTRARGELFQTRLGKRWAVTMWPTEAVARAASMNLAELSTFVKTATFLDRPDPVAAWSDLASFQSRLIDVLSGGDEIRIEADGTDLTLRVGGRTWINSDGKRNMPSGEVFTGPLEDSANGTIRYTISASPAGVAVRGISLTFKEGRVVEASAEVGGEYLERMLSTDEGARRLGEIGIGTNFGIDRSIGQILFDEKIGGSVHLAIGNSYAESGGVNVSAVHWDMICDLRPGGRLLLDSQVIQENGKFLVG